MGYSQSVNFLSVEEVVMGDRIDRSLHFPVVYETNQDDDSGFVRTSFPVTGTQSVMGAHYVMGTHTHTERHSSVIVQKTSLSLYLSKSLIPLVVISP